MTVRRLRVLIQGLPPQSATMTALRNGLSDEELAEQADRGEPEKGRWSQQEQLLAAVYDRLGAIQHVLVLSNHSGKGPKPKPPELMRRPGAKPKRQKQPLTEAGAEFLFQLINGGDAA
jgi:hypothetical protein